jgi:hypothetical protein
MGDGLPPDALYCELGNSALLTDPRLKVPISSTSRPFVYCASTSSTPVHAVIGALGGALAPPIAAKPD